MPEGTFDLIVFSEIGYYFDPTALLGLAEALFARLRNPGMLIAVHWLGISPDHRLTGDQVHDLLAAAIGVPSHSRRYEGFRLDSWSRM